MGQCYIFCHGSDSNGDKCDGNTISEWEKRDSNTAVMEMDSTEF